MVTTKERSFIAASIRPVAAIWLSAPSNSHGQNAAPGHDTASPVASSTTAKNTSENGKPNRKRILVAPQVPSGPVSCRCIALRATWPIAATKVKGIQSAATENMGVITCARGGTERSEHSQRDERTRDGQLGARSCRYAENAGARYVSPTLPEHGLLPRPAFAGRGVG